MTNAVEIDVQFFQLCSGNFPQRDDLRAREQMEKSFQCRQAGRAFGFVWRAIAQQPAARIE